MKRKHIKKKQTKKAVKKYRRATKKSGLPALVKAFVKVYSSPD